MPEPPPKYVVEPFLQRQGSEIYNPMTGATAAVGSDLARAIERWNGIDACDALVDNGWVVPAHDAGSERFLLRYASIETFSICNQACEFCPVSVDPRPRELMSQPHFERLLDELTAYRPLLEGVFLNFYNEPTIDPLFLDRLSALAARDIPTALLTNGSGLTAAVLGHIRQLGGIAYLSVNLNTMDAARYEQTRARSHQYVVLRNLRRAADPPISPQMQINVLGDGSRRHQDDFAEVSEWGRRHGYGATYFVANARCQTEQPRLTGRMHGCEQMRSRPFNHLHVTANGDCVLCCQDYYGRHQLGNVFELGVEGVMSGMLIAGLREQIHGLRDADEDLLCRHCEFALESPALASTTDFAA